MYTQERGRGRYLPTMLGHYSGYLYRTSRVTRDNYRSRRTGGTRTVRVIASMYITMITLTTIDRCRGRYNTRVRVRARRARSTRGVRPFDRNRSCIISGEQIYAAMSLRRRGRGAGGGRGGQGGAHEMPVEINKEDSIYRPYVRTSQRD